MPADDVSGDRRPRRCGLMAKRIAQQNTARRLSRTGFSLRHFFRVPLRPRGTSGVRLVRPPARAAAHRRHGRVALLEQLRSAHRPIN